MSSIGPELPPHLLAKRKRQNIDDDNAPAPTRSRTTSPTSSSDGGEKRRRILGPSLPPAPLDERPTTSPDLEKDSDSDSDDDLGPALPPPTGSYSHQAEVQRLEALEQETSAREAAKKPQREEWMLVPPKQDDWSSRVDPTKLKNRKFNTGKGAKAPSQKGGSDNALWTETPEQKRQRLEDEVMGVKTPAQLDTGSKKSSTNEAEARETERRIREYNEKNRGNASLYDAHKKTVPKEKEDDPSKRAFDKEKDIGGGMKIGHAKRKELLNKAADFGSKFAGGSYL